MLPTDRGTLKSLKPRSLYFEIGERIQRGLSADLPRRFHIRRFESVLAVFNHTVEAYLSSA